jgi:hypothetical protein
LWFVDVLKCSLLLSSFSGFLVTVAPSLVVSDMLDWCFFYLNLFPGSFSDLLRSAGLLLSGSLGSVCGGTLLPQFYLDNFCYICTIDMHVWVE